MVQATEALIGVVAHSIALFETVATSPFAQLSMIPLLTLVAIYAPAGHRATWFALMASLMNLALQAGALQTKYLNLIFHIERGSYGNLPALTVVAMTIGLRAARAGHRTSSGDGSVRAAAFRLSHLRHSRGRMRVEGGARLDGAQVRAHSSKRGEFLLSGGGGNAWAIPMDCPRRGPRQFWLSWGPGLAK